MTTEIHVELPSSLCVLACVGRQVVVRAQAPVTLRSVLDALEATFPVLRGAIRDHATQQRRPFIRFFACEQDWSHRPPDEPLPAAVVEGSEVLLVVGAIAGG